MRINHAILHICDFTACENIFSPREIDLSDKTAKNYVMRHVRKALGNLDNKRGSFVEGSGFATELRNYFSDTSTFVSLSTEIAEFISTELGHSEKPISTDILIVDFEDDTELKRAAKAAREAAAEAELQEMEDEADEGVEPSDEVETSEAEECPFDPDPVADTAAQRAFDHATGFSGPLPRYFAIILLDSKQAYVHETRYDDEGEFNSIARHHAVLPNPSQKLASYALVDLRSLAVQFVDKKRNIAGEDCFLIPDKLLQCTQQASSRETIAAVTEIVEAVADEYGENPTVALSRAKTYVSENVSDEDEIDLDQMAEAVFEDSPARTRFEQAAAAQEIPEHVPIEREAAQRVVRRHKIRTDTGIEVTFPAEYGQNPEYITFTSESDGTISIGLKNILHIENR
ncbi:hypothetical protein AAY81_07090 [Denitrobacterium detoxificans]|uniref:Nucleoid-associated protein YejK n=1 Tax=Denitrobacterium detoxificans TaxID=79604 RepID=A0A172RYX4_9ACTN|nr:nucleoid-associated protein [Denitrobacterium detoxificans]ANE22918.1 hypothetical protein AAY81_07090 [Denitrobacterium detoxificans]SEO71766.1 hypothetical protein SAMN02910314_00984 [Denitrobacterium detoxificans]